MKREKHLKSLFSRLALGLAASTLLAAPATGEVITFGFSDIDRLDLAGPQIEGAFQYTATVGDGWEIGGNHGNPASSLQTFRNDEVAEIGDIVEIRRVDGGLFNFTSVDVSAGFTGASDQVTITGLLAGFPTQTSPVLSASSQTFYTTVPSGFTAPVDLLRVKVTFNNGSTNALYLDNFVVPAVPEPGALGLVAIGAVALLARCCRQPGSDYETGNRTNLIC